MRYYNIKRLWIKQTVKIYIYIYKNGENNEEIKHFFIQNIVCPSNKGYRYRNLDLINLKCLYLKQVYNIELQFTKKEKLCC